MFVSDTAATESYTVSRRDARAIWPAVGWGGGEACAVRAGGYDDYQRAEAGEIAGGLRSAASTAVSVKEEPEGGAYASRQIGRAHV